ncbi:glycosyltransferase [Thermodesulfobacteriota bacterium]
MNRKHFEKTRGLEKEPISIVFLLQDLEFGGTQRYAINILKHLDRNKFAPELWVLRGGDDMIPLAENSGMKIKRLSNSRRVGPRSIINLFWKLLRHRPHILYTLTVVPNIWGRISGKLAGVPVIISGYRSMLPKQHEKLLWPISAKIICNADTLRDEMINRFSVDKSRITVIPNAVDTNIFCPKPEEEAHEPTILFVGRLVKEKNPLNLLDAFKFTAEKHPSARLLIIGNGRLKKILLEKIRALSLDNKIEIVQGTDGIISYLRKAWIFVLASDREASPNVILEAMAAGLPVVATRVGGIPELVENGKNGILVEPGNPARLAEALIELLENEQKRKELGLRARERVIAHHNLKDVIAQTENVILATFEGRAEK